MFPIDPPENMRKPLAFLMFSGGSRGNTEKKRVNETEVPFWKNTYPAYLFLTPSYVDSSSAKGR